MSKDNWKIMPRKPIVVAKKKKKKLNHVGVTIKN